MELKFEEKYINTDGKTVLTLKIDIALGHGIGALEISIIIIIKIVDTVYAVRLTRNRNWHIFLVVRLTCNRNNGIFSMLSG